MKLFYYVRLVCYAPFIFVLMISCTNIPNIKALTRR